VGSFRLSATTEVKIEELRELLGEKKETSRVVYKRQPRSSPSSSKVFSVSLGEEKAFDDAYREMNEEGGDLFLLRLAAEKKYTKAPHVVKDVAKYADEGELVLYRGMTKKRYAVALKEGKYFAGRGLFGSGIYATEDFKEAKSYGDFVLKMTLKRGSHVATEEELKKHIDSFLSSLEEEKKKLFSEATSAYLSGDVQKAEALLAQQEAVSKQILRAERLLQNEGSAATLFGFDAYRPKSGMMLILNRGAIRVQEEVL